MAGRGPLPAKSKVRRNAPSIPTTNLPAGGRRGRVPKVPGWVELGPVGLAWWGWAWRTPQAAAWDPIGHAAVVARRAALEDDLVAAATVEGLDLDGLDGESADVVRRIVGRLAALVTGRIAIVREMRDLDDRLGLSPKAMAALRWEIVAETPVVSVADEVSTRRVEREIRMAARG